MFISYAMYSLVSFRNYILNSANFNHRDIANFQQPQESSDLPGKPPKK
jgi:hypothetical protein